MLLVLFLVAFLVNGCIPGPTAVFSEGTFLLSTYSGIYAFDSERISAKELLRNRLTGRDEIAYEHGIISPDRKAFCVIARSPRGEDVGGGVNAIELLTPQLTERRRLILPDDSISWQTGFLPDSTMIWALSDAATNPLDLLVYSKEGPPETRQHLLLLDLDSDNRIEIDMDSLGDSFVYYVSVSPGGHRLALSTVDKANRATSLVIADLASGQIRSPLSAITSGSSADGVGEPIKGLIYGHAWLAEDRLVMYALNEDYPLNADGVLYETRVSKDASIVTTRIGNARGNPTVNPQHDEYAVFVQQDNNRILRILSMNNLRLEDVSLGNTDTSQTSLINWSSP
ncbi:MAG: hypothetical protein V1748_02495 [Actinomycetota bacterium]